MRCGCGGVTRLIGNSATGASLCHFRILDTGCRCDAGRATSSLSPLIGRARAYAICPGCKAQPVLALTTAWRSRPKHFARSSITLRHRREPQPIVAEFQDVAESTEMPSCCAIFLHQNINRIKLVDDLIVKLVAIKLDVRSLNRADTKRLDREVVRQWTTFFHFSAATFASALEGRIRVARGTIGTISLSARFCHQG
jgi:hypothetical protein